MRAEHAEQQIIGSMLIYEDRALQALDKLSVEDFTGRERDDFARIKAAYEKYGHDGLMSNSELSADDIRYYTDLATTHIDGAVEAVRGMTVRRKLTNILADLSVEVREGVDPAGAAVGAIEQMSNVVNDSSTLREQTMSQVMREAVETIEKIRAGEVFGLRTGLDIDKKIGGFQDGLFYLIAARPSMGKTALALQVACQMSKTVPGAFLSLETTNRNIGMRHLVRESMIDAEKIREGRINDYEFRQIMDYAQRLSGYDLITDDTTDISAGGIFMKANYLKRKYGIGFIFIDYVQLMKSGKDSREQQIADVSRSCVMTAKELDIPVIGLAQLSRKNEDRTDKRPMLSDLRDSGQLEQDAYCVTFLHRPEYYGQKTYEDGSSTAGICEAIIAKNKDGPTGIKKMLFEKEHMKFNNLVQGAPF